MSDYDQSFAHGALLLTRQGPVAQLTLNRPERRNALNESMWSALPGIAAEVEADPAVKVLILTGAGDTFAAGADITEFEAVYATRATSEAYGVCVASGMEAIAALSKPVVARIAGACVGGGLALALACDLRLAAADARLGVTPAKLGLMYSLADTRRLVEAVGMSAAKDLLFTGRFVDAEEARALRLVDAVAPPRRLDAVVAAKAEAIAAASQWSVRRTKAVAALLGAGVRNDTEQTVGWSLNAVEGEDFREGLDAFLAKRPPRFPYG